VPQFIFDDCDFFFPKDILVSYTWKFQFLADLKHPGTRVADTSCDLFGRVLCLHIGNDTTELNTIGKIFGRFKSFLVLVLHVVSCTFFSFLQRFLPYEEVTVVE